MKKIFLYLYPIEDYMSDYLHKDDEDYDIFNDGLRPLPILNECIQKRYRDKGYQIVYAIFPNRELFGLDLKKNDKIIYTDCLFESPFKYPNEQFLIDQLGNISELVIGGYHFSDCVKKVGEYSYITGIPTLVDLDLTELFFKLYYKKNYFNIDEYNLKKFFKYAKYDDIYFGERIRVYTAFSSPIYGKNKKIVLK